MSAYDFKHDFVWTLDNCTPLTEEFKSLQGTPFCPKLGYLDSFYFELEFDHNSWNLFLRKVSGAALKNLKVSCCITIENTTCAIWFEYSSGSEKPLDETKTRLMSKNFSGYYKEQLGREFLWPDHKVVLKGTLYFFEENADNESLSNLSLVNCKQLHADFERLYKDGISCDIQFCFGEKKLSAHKAILECCSPVFKKMFEVDSCPCYFSISDFDIHEFDCFLLFLYTGKIENSSQYTVLSLLAMANKYEVESLRNACLRALRKELSIDSVCSILNFADENNHNELKGMAKSFIRKHFNEVARTREWCKIVLFKPELACEE